MLDKSSDQFYRPDDALTSDVVRQTVTGHTDRFILIFRNHSK
ncbi:hypothetical protein [Paraglaciecola psychrophila]|uniref:Uncharacterized protein n=1 Tax=Paraglaciecola psychrophila 170 TaxID=1129794 RepID=K6ZTC5_9ALTE|nr:hypothetical protein [Paraglaciecola psychrophila]AGH46510.1 hypothetical protein C427_4408 [Paraglaciecola psychrophila 170]GAC39161.1 hypothetical protein GPSY_3550 [Paraglaciecola psychrophila 170]